MIRNGLNVVYDKRFTAEVEDDEKGPFINLIPLMGGPPFVGHLQYQRFGRLWKIPRNWFFVSRKLS